MVLFVCLNCWHRWESRKKDVDRRECSKCHSRSVTEFELLKDAVQGVHEWFDSHRILSGQTRYNPLDAPFLALREIPDIRRLLQDSPFLRGARTLQKVLEMGRDYNSDEYSNISSYILKKVDQFQA